jgi:hypothetical protein
MENKLLRFLGASYLLLHSQSVLTNAHASEGERKVQPEKMQQIARKGEEGEIQTFSGTIVKSGDTFTLNDVSDKAVYQLDDPQKASQFEGKRVNIKGTLDSTKKLIHVQTIEEAA